MCVEARVVRSATDHGCNDGAVGQVALSDIVRINTFVQVELGDCPLPARMHFAIDTERKLWVSANLGSGHSLDARSTASLGRTRRVVPDTLQEVIGRTMQVGLCHGALQTRQARSAALEDQACL